MLHRHLRDDEREAPRPVPGSYWVVPGRLLAGEYPGSHSRAEALERVRQFVTEGFTYFVDLTEADELPPYDGLLPVHAPSGRRVEYYREPIPDHGVPDRAETISRILGRIEDAVDAGHKVYLHCRAGIGRSAMVVACWLVNRGSSPQQALEQLQALWRQSRRAETWPSVPETEAQADFVLGWSARRGPAPAFVPAAPAPAARPPAALGRAERIRAALLGLACGDAFGFEFEQRRDLRPGAATTSMPDSDFAGVWTQPTATTLCLAESLLTVGGFDGRDQIERYLRWQKEGHLSATGEALGLTTDVSRALATYHWRGLPMAGPHDPRERSTASLPRVLAAVLFEPDEPRAAVELAAECSRTTQQSPFVLDACRYLAAMLFGALRGDEAGLVLGPGYDPAPGLWRRRALKSEIARMAADLDWEPPGPDPDDAAPVHEGGDATQAVARARRCVARTDGVSAAVRLAVATGDQPALDGALAGALAGALRGASGLDERWRGRVAQRDLLERYAAAFERRRPG